jgi:DNA-binding CsgD family transcriptional regulator
VEAAERSGHRDVAEEAFDRIAPCLLSSQTDWGLGVLARLRAILASDEDAEAWFTEALERLREAGIVPDLARTHLLYGEWLRRESRRLEARAELRVAHEQLSSMGMQAFAERADGELRATGEKVRRRIAETRDDLTSQERQIAQLAREGLSNPEIGARLFLSPRTVEWHLRHVFAKLEIRSRRQLANALQASGSAVPAT